MLNTNINNDMFDIVISTVCALFWFGVCAKRCLALVPDFYMPNFKDVGFWQRRLLIGIYHIWTTRDHNHLHVVFFSLSLDD